MTKHQDNIHTDTAAAELASVETQPFSVGTTLREARARLGLSVAEVSDRIKFAPRQIEALEADDFARLPELAFVRGFVRSYARLLQLDPVTILAALPQPAVQSMLEGDSTLAEVPFPTQTNKSNIIWLAAALVVVVVLVLFAWLRGSTPDVQHVAQVSDDSKSKVETLQLPEAMPVSAVQELAVASSVTASPAIPVAITQAAPKVAAPVVAIPIAASAVQVPAKPVSPDSAAQRAGTIRLTFDRDAWVEVKDKDGKILLSQINHPGSEQSLGGSPPFTLVIGSASGVHLYYKGQPVDLASHTKVSVAHLTLE